MKIYVETQADAVAVCRVLTEAASGINCRMDAIKEMVIRDNLCAIRDSIEVRELKNENG